MGVAVPTPMVREGWCASHTAAIATTSTPTGSAMVVRCHVLAAQLLIDMREAHVEATGTIVVPNIYALCGVHEGSQCPGTPHGDGGAHPRFTTRGRTHPGCRGARTASLDRGGDASQTRVDLGGSVGTSGSSRATGGGKVTVNRIGRQVARSGWGREKALTCVAARAVSECPQLLSTRQSLVVRVACSRAACPPPLWQPGLRLSRSACIGQSLGQAVHPARATMGTGRSNVRASNVAHTRVAGRRIDQIATTDPVPRQDRNGFPVAAETSGTSALA